MLAASLRLWRLGVLAATFGSAGAIGLRFEPAPAAWPEPRPDLTPYGHQLWERRHEADLNRMRGLCRSGPLDALLLGDSIAESWLRPAFDERKEVPLEYSEKEKLPNGANLEAAFGPRAAVAAIGGDTTLDLGWRLQQGRLGEAVKHCAPRTVYLLIGTNDLGARHKAPHQVDTDVRELVGKLVRVLRPGARLVLQLLLPRTAGGHRETLQWAACPGANETTDQALQANVIDRSDTCARFFPAVTTVNRMMAAAASDFSASGHNVEPLDCTRFFLDVEGRISKVFYTDLLHLSAAGYGRWVECLGNYQTSSLGAVLHLIGAQVKTSPARRRHQ